MPIGHKRRTTRTELERVFCRWIYFHLSTKICLWPSWRGGGSMEPPLTLPMRHSNDEAVNSERGWSVDHLFHCRNQNVAAFQSEAPFRRILLGEKLFEVCRAQQALYQRSLLVAPELHDARRLEALLDPVTLLQVVDVHVLQTDVFAVDLLADRHKHAARSVGFPCTMIANYSASRKEFPTNILSTGLSLLIPVSQYCTLYRSMAMSRVVSHIHSVNVSTAVLSQYSKCRLIWQLSHVVTLRQGRESWV